MGNKEGSVMYYPNNESLTAHYERFPQAFQQVYPQAIAAILCRVGESDLKKWGNPITLLSNVRYRANTAFSHFQRFACFWVLIGYGLESCPLPNIWCLCGHRHG